MATNQDVLMKKSTMSGVPLRSSSPERRGSRRCKITQLMRLRPSDPEKQPFEDLRGTVSVSRSGIYFHTTELGYEIGMRLFVTMPYSYNPSSMSREYLAEVVRKDILPNGTIGIGFKTLLEMSEQPSYSFGSSGQRK
jgi:hypothetical protein